MAARTHRLRVTVDDRERSPNLEVPFDVPDGARSLQVRLAYDRSTAVIDLGCRGSEGFRGWSGGARDEYVIGHDRATPGYLPAELEPGEWAVVLGLHRVPFDGVDIIVEIAVPAERAPEPDPAAPPVPARRPRRPLPAPPGLVWLATDLHAHTLHSDGSLSVPQLAALGVAAGLDVLAVTDHNTVSHHRELGPAGHAYGIGLLPGQELTTDRGHANAFGDIGWVDFRQPASRWVRDVAAAGGLSSINHPLTADCAWLHPLDAHPPLAEVWHWSWLDRTWSAPIAWWRAWDAIGDGAATTPVGGSDFHTPGQGHPLGEPVTWVACDTAQAGTSPAEAAAAVLAGLAAGRTAISASYDAPALLRVDDELVAIGADGTVLVDADGRRRPVRGELARFPGTPGPQRLETTHAEILALSG